MKRLTFGGNFQVLFGTYTFVYISPTVGYRVTDNVNVGLGFIYNFSSINYGPPYGKVSQSIYGAHTYARYIFAQNLFVQAQFDKLYQPDWFSRIPNDKTWVNYLLIGGGFRQQVGSRAALMTSIMYNLTPSPLSIYPGRIIIQFGFVAGL